ncbi:hypothetical protein BD289DRAFT_28839 [Coniella lustricola]|uniref:Uncharacterized protein n=1 Tax=Coniella lustricola TaxID=2025994 RepID=A0A2T3AJ16_9PEZI|nr:hypothetical protein BD289DRAFT_28839 [Coniella lustricola]
MLPTKKEPYAAAYSPLQQPPPPSQLQHLARPGASGVQRSHHPHCAPYALESPPPPLLFEPTSEISVHLASLDFVRIPFRRLLTLLPVSQLPVANSHLPKTTIFSHFIHHTPPPTIPDLSPTRFRSRDPALRTPDDPEPDAIEPLCQHDDDDDDDDNDAEDDAACLSALLLLACFCRLLAAATADLSCATPTPTPLPTPTPTPALSSQADTQPPGAARPLRLPSLLPRSR